MRLSRVVTEIERDGYISLTENRAKQLKRLISDRQLTHINIMPQFDFGILREGWYWAFIPSHPKFTRMIKEHFNDAKLEIHNLEVQLEHRRRMVKKLSQWL